MSENTKPAGEGVSDEDMASQVAGETDSEVKWGDFFAQEEDGALTDREAAKADADEARP